MDATPETKYARSGDCYIAYQVLGSGPVDIVFFGPLVGHVELIWDDPPASRFLRRLASGARLILFDKRGTGMSDPVPSHEALTLDQRQEDVLAVMDAAGSERAVLVGSSEGGQLALMVAASHPERATALVLHSSYARVARADDYPAGYPSEVSERMLDGIGELWGSQSLVEIILPSAATTSGASTGSVTSSSGRRARARRPRSSG